MRGLTKSIWVMGLLVGALTRTGWADDPRAEKLYGDGVHAFYRGDYSRAIRNLDLATGYGSQDPRVFYFRGVAKYRQGRTDEARFDFQYGAQLEASQGRADVGRSLQRVQGRDRVVLEQYRRQARRLVQLAPRPAASVNPPEAVTATPPAEPQIVRKPVSEIPEPLQNLPEDPQDPFAEQAAGLLGRGDLQQATAETDLAAEPTATPATPADGLATEGQAEITDVGAGEDAFGADDPFAGPSTPADSTPAQGDLFDDASPPATAPGGGSGRGTLGAVFRALTKGATSTPAIKQGQELLQGARGALPGGGPVPVPPAPQDQNDLFDDNAPTDTPADDPLMDNTDEPAPGGVDDPFADDPGPAPADDAAAADSLDEPFADDPGAGPSNEPPPPADQDDPFADDPLP